MEVVSPKLNTTQNLTETFSDFWEAMRVHFNPQRDISCGGHVHVTPMNLTSRFSLKSLKRIAFATVFYEDYIDTILPRARRENKFCVKNSKSPGSGVSEAMAWGKSASVLQRIATTIRGLKSEVDLYMYMQGNRYVLWNFQNTIPNPKTGRSTGTVEFRGGNQFLSTSGTLAWLAFVLGFVTLALQEASAVHSTIIRVEILTVTQDLMAKFTSSLYTSLHDADFLERVVDWWKRIRKAAKKSKLGRHLPSDYTKMKTR